MSDQYDLHAAIRRDIARAVMAKEIELDIAASTISSLCAEVERLRKTLEQIENMFWGGDPDDIRGFIAKTLRGDHETG